MEAMTPCFISSLITSMGVVCRSSASSLTTTLAGISSVLAGGPGPGRVLRRGGGVRTRRTSSRLAVVEPQLTQVRRGTCLGLGCAVTGLMGLGLKLFELFLFLFFYDDRAPRALRLLRLGLRLFRLALHLLRFLPFLAVAAVCGGGQDLFGEANAPRCGLNRGLRRCGRFQRFRHGLGDGGSGLPPLSLNGFHPRLRPSLPGRGG